MGEAKRRRAAAVASEKFPGGAHRCPRCLSTNVTTADVPDGVTFYARRLAICACGAAWEPIDEAFVWDRDDEYCSTQEPCDNCAFRPGSPEQANATKWNELIENLKSGGQFFCHKGVPIDPDSKDGFAYPRDRNKLRLCRGYLNALGKWWAAKEATAK